MALFAHLSLPSSSPSPTPSLSCTLPRCGGPYASSCSPCHTTWVHDDVADELRAPAAGCLQAAAVARKGVDLGACAFSPGNPMGGEPPLRSSRRKMLHSTRRAVGVFAISDSAPTELEVSLPDQLATSDSTLTDLEASMPDQLKSTPAELEVPFPDRLATSNSTPTDSEVSLPDNVAHKPRRIALFVEPSPFAYISGYKNRFQNFIKYLKEMGDEVIVVTTHQGAPDHFHGAKVVPSWSFPCPWYTVVPLSLALSPRIIMEVAKFKPDIIHASSPGIMVVGALIIAKLLRKPLVLSYHTHVPVYIPKYTFSWLVKPMWLIIKILHRAADLTLVTSSVVGRELQAAGAAAAYKIRLWRKGVDSENFHPRFKSSEMRLRLSAGEPDRPLIVHVGRLGAEKNLDFLKIVLERMPEARLAFVGDGPWRHELEKMFEGFPVVFTGMLHGEELSQAYASGDVFITPSESETLGLVVLEAMASGVPIVAARAGGIPDIIPAAQEGETGFLYTPGDVDDCVSKLRALFTSKELCEKMGAAGRVEVEKHDWRAATRHVRNEEYNAAIWFWKKRRSQLSRWFAWSFRRTPLRQIESAA